MHVMRKSNAKPQGICIFLFGWFCVCAEGLQVAYNIRDDGAIKGLTDMLAALAFVPINDVDQDCSEEEIG